MEEDKGNGEGSENESDMASRLSGVYAKDWVNDFVEPDESMMEEGTKTIDFLLKRYKVLPGDYSKYFVQAMRRFSPDRPPSRPPFPSPAHPSHIFVQPKPGVFSLRKTTALARLYY